MVARGKQKAKRKRTTIDDVARALARNVVVNATPAGGESTEAAKKRRTRRAVQAGRLRNELYTHAAEYVPGSADDDTPHGALLRSQHFREERDATPSQETPQSHKDRVARRKEHRRTFANQMEQLSLGDAQAHGSENERVLDPETRRAAEALDRAMRAAAERRRLQLLPDAERLELTARRTAQQARRRLDMDDTTREEDQRRHALGEARRRASQNADVDVVIRDDPVEEESVAARRKRARRPVRYGHALSHHSDFNPSRVSGADLNEARRHRLPPSTPCVWCGTMKWPGESAVICCCSGAVRLPPLLPAPKRLYQIYGDPDFRKKIRAYNQVFAFTSIGAARTDGSGVGPVREDTAVQGQRGVYTYRIQGAMGHYLGSLLPYTDSSTGESVKPKFAQIYVVDPDMRSCDEVPALPSPTWCPVPEPKGSGRRPSQILGRLTEKASR